MKKNRILWGVCGIGLGHARRQLPVIQHYARSSEITIFTYGSGLPFFRRHFRAQPHIRIHEVSVPYWCGNPEGLDFAGTARAPQNACLDFSINAMAMEMAHKQIGCPHLVVSDYEPISAQYAYAFNAPLVTLDQQSKYLDADLPSRLAGTALTDEIMRLRMFFPKADKRMACSFFTVKQHGQRTDPIRIVPPILADGICNMRRQPDPAPLIMVYLSEQLKDAERIQALVGVLAESRTACFAVYLSRDVSAPRRPNNVLYYRHGSKAFPKHMAACHGIISTAGHSLLSEAMHLKIPVMALPLPVYEQQMNAQTIRLGGFGMSVPHLTARNLREFLANLTRYQHRIHDDHHLLLRGNGLPAVRKEIDEILLRGC